MCACVCLEGGGGRKEGGMGRWKGEGRGVALCNASVPLLEKPQRKHHIYIDVYVFLKGLKITDKAIVVGRHV